MIKLNGKRLLALCLLPVRDGAEFILVRAADRGDNRPVRFQRCGGGRRVIRKLIKGE